MIVYVRLPRVRINIVPRFHSGPSYAAERAPRLIDGPQAVRSSRVFGAQRNCRLVQRLVSRLLRLPKIGATHFSVVCRRN